MSYNYWFVIFCFLFSSHTKMIKIVIWYSLSNDFKMIHNITKCVKYVLHTYEFEDCLVLFETLAVNKYIFCHTVYDFENIALNYSNHVVLNNLITPRNLSPIPPTNPICTWKNHKNHILKPHLQKNDIFRKNAQRQSSNIL